MKGLSLLGFVLIVGFSALSVYCWRRWWRERGSGGPEQGPGNGPGGGWDAPPLAPLPHGTGPTLRFVPPEWVEENLEAIAKMVKPKPNSPPPDKPGRRREKRRIRSG